MTLAQKKARENFKKAIAYRKKTGCSLKQAFAYVKTGKVGAYKVIQKGEKKNAKVTKVLEQKRTKTGKFASLKRVSGVKKAAKKKAVSSHKDTKSHNVNIRVVSGFNSMPQELMYLLSEKRKAEENFAVAKANYKKKGIDKESKEHYTFWYNRYRDYIKHLNKRILIVKRHIK
jgi:hypothetical protein